MPKYYAVVTFGSPSIRYARIRQDRDRAINDAARAKGSGTCTAAHVLECDSRRLAQEADISVVNPGTRTIFVA